jgi:hypothetical protein
MRSSQYGPRIADRDIAQPSIRFGAVAREPLHHLRTASYVTIEVHTRVIRLRFDGDIVGPGTGGSKSAKQETNPEADDRNNNKVPPLAQ